MHLPDCPEARHRVRVCRLWAHSFCGSDKGQACRRRGGPCPSRWHGALWGGDARWLRMGGRRCLDRRATGCRRRGWRGACPTSRRRLDRSSRCFGAWPTTRSRRELRRPPERQDEIGHLPHEPAEDPKAQEGDGEGKAETHLSLQLCEHAEGGNRPDEEEKKQNGGQSEHSGGGLPKCVGPRLRLRCAPAP